MTVNFSGPWGEYTMDEKAPYAGLIKYGLIQLKYLQKHQKDTEYIRNDISGYEQLLATKNVEESCRIFTITKQDANSTGKRFKDNLAVVEHLKKNGLWNE